MYKHENSLFPNDKVYEYKKHSCSNYNIEICKYEKDSESNDIKINKKTLNYEEFISHINDISIKIINEQHMPELYIGEGVYPMCKASRISEGRSLFYNALRNIIPLEMYAKIFNALTKSEKLNGISLSTGTGECEALFFLLLKAKSNLTNTNLSLKSFILTDPDYFQWQYATQKKGNKENFTNKDLTKTVAFSCDVMQSCIENIYCLPTTLSSSQNETPDRITLDQFSWPLKKNDDNNYEKIFDKERLINNVNFIFGWDIYENNQTLSNAGSHLNFENGWLTLGNCAGLFISTFFYNNNPLFLLINPDVNFTKVYYFECTNLKGDDYIFYEFKNTKNLNEKRELIDQNGTLTKFVKNLKNHILNEQINIKDKSIDTLCNNLIIALNTYLETDIKQNPTDTDDKEKEITITKIENPVGEQKNNAPKTKSSDDIKKRASCNWKIITFIAIPSFIILFLPKIISLIRSKTIRS